ncbi:MAG: hypothetical protein ACMUIG_03995 [Thermoplasmatota archaeon]
MMTIASMIQYSIFEKLPNYLEIGPDVLVFQNTWQGFHTTVQNVVPIFLVKEIGRPDSSYFKERRKKTHWLFKMTSFTSKPPHGGLYIPYTSRENLLILFLHEPVLISNTNFLPARRPPMMKISKEWVKEIIVDIDPGYHDHFVNEIRLRKQSGINQYPPRPKIR